MALFDGKAVIVTGGTGGLGSAVVADFLREGASVFVPYQHDDQIERLHAQLGLEPGAGATLSGSFVNLTDVAAVEQAYTAFAERLGGIDILVNCAGGFAGGTPVHKTSWDVWQQQLDMNLKTVVVSCQAAIPHMITRGSGAIVNVSSRTATQAGAHLSAYAAAKRAILQLTEALAAELREQNITANAILPSVIDTPTNRAGMPDADHSRWVTPGEIADVILFLCSPSARIISGAAIPVYGKA
ncbi:MAG: SDR family NAD(P)-dependent oxidoreductase [Roseiflexaceae bacterium]|nr:SDR family NAD(P)-dependent oxidoreductase [Roseiflexaceae bacterium]